MQFDYYHPFKDKEGNIKPGIKPQVKSWADIKKIMSEKWFAERIDKVRSAPNKEEKAIAKKNVPGVIFTGRTESTRMASAMIPTQLAMVDIDKCEKDPKEIWQRLFELKGNDWICDNIVLAHITCGGRGLRIVLRGQKGLTTLIDNMKWFSEQFPLEEGEGEYDDAVHDFSRLSFLTKADEILFEHSMLYMETEPELEGDIVNPANNPNGGKDNHAGDLTKLADEAAEFSQEEIEKFEAFDYRGINVRTIVEKYVELRGEPSAGEVHNFYNEMVKNFRCICSNNKRMLLYILPRFGHTAEECWSQILSICKVNTLSSLPKDFYFFLKDNGYYVPSGAGQGALQQYMLNEKPNEEFVEPPYLPPVIRELVSCAPKDFVIPSVNALLPIIGTLTSYVAAEYPYDNRLHTTSFFSVIYAPPGTGKGFVERFKKLLLKYLDIRDSVQNAKERFYLDKINKKGSNEKSPDNPNTSLRIMEPKNSETELLEKQRNNHGYHMFTFAAEMDTWAKGVRAAGGNKDDLVRVAWDNEVYGQYYKNAGTFKGKVQLFWNLLITGTLQQLLHYFKNVENGLVTRCSFTSIENQQFAEPPIWKPLGAKALKTIEDFIKRCDENSYETPCNVNPSDLDCMTEEQFEEEVDWHFKYKERQIVDLDWIMPEIRDFLREQINQSALDVDVARDVFRRRVAVRGFRLALMCTCLYNRHMTKTDIANCRKFVRWWMERDIEGIMKLWGPKYNEQVNNVPIITQKSVFDQLSSRFTKNDVFACCIKQGVKTPVKMVVYNWKKLGYIEKVGDNVYKKIN